MKKTKNTRKLLAISVASVLLLSGTMLVAGTGDCGCCPCECEGCTPGYWKNPKHDWPAPYTRDTYTGDVFPVLDGTALDVKLDDALRLKGGKGWDGGARLLVKHAVAALLNIAHPDVNYPRGLNGLENLIFTLFNTYHGRATLLSYKDIIDTDNNLGCPL